MSARTYFAISGGIFFAAGLFHLLRLCYHWPVRFGSWMAPHGLSYLGLPVAWALAAWAYRLHRR